MLQQTTKADLPLCSVKIFVDVGGRRASLAPGLLGCLPPFDTLGLETVEEAETGAVDLPC